MQLGDVYQIRVISGLTDGQTSVQNWYYRCSVEDVSSVAGHVWVVFYDTVGDLYAPLMDEDYTVDTYQVINGMDNDDFAEGIVNDTGSRTGGQLPTFVTCSIRSSRQGPGFVHSHRGMPFGNVTDINPTGGTWASGFLTAMDTFVGVLRDDMVVSGGAEIEPVQLDGGFTLGVNPVVKQVLDGNWEVNRQLSALRTRQTYDWQ